VSGGKRGLAVLALLAAVVAGAAPVAAQPTTPIQTATDQLFLIFLLFAIGVAAVVYGAIAYALVKYRARPGPDMGRRPVTHHRTLEIVWTAAAAAIVIVLVAVSLPALLALEGPAQQADYTVEVYAQQFFWSFRYPDGSESTNELWVQEDLTYLLEVRSRDVIHSFFVPELDARIDAVPGRVNYVWIQPEQPGRYALVCAEFCGVGHSDMRGTVVVFPTGQQPLPYGLPPDRRLGEGVTPVELRDDFIDPPVLDVGLGDAVSLLLVNNGSSTFAFVVEAPYNLTVEGLAPGEQAWLNFTANVPAGEVAFFVVSRRDAGAEGVLRVSEADLVVDVELREFGAPGGRWSIAPGEIRVNPGDRVALRVWVNSTYADGQNIVEHNFTLKAPLWLRVGTPYLDDFRWLNFTAPAEAVRVEYICEVPGHAELGMVGFLVVGEPEAAQEFAFPPYIILLVVIAAAILVFLARILSKRPR
jgi:cytochrome c oxidase subunit II